MASSSSSVLATPKKAADKRTAAKARPVGECPVCCNAYTADQRKPIACPGCNYAACVSCVKTYLLGSLSDPACMSCGLYWCRAFLGASLPATWLNGDLKKHRERVLMDREHSLMPETQPLVEREAERRARDEIRRKRYEEYKQAQINLRNARIAWSDAQHVVRYGEQREDQREEPKERRAFVAACPDANCRGFLSTQYKCGTCLQRFCAHCREPKLEGVDHVCDPGTVETIALIAKVTRACPNCGMAIERISGCDHMWCTGCDTGFSYTTGQRIANNRNTNPHMYERMRQLQAARGAETVQHQAPPVDCGGGFVTWPEGNFKASGTWEGFLMSMHNTGRHVEHVLRTWPTVAQDNAQLRVRYCLKDLDAKRFGARLQQNEKHREYLIETRHILESFVLMTFEFVMMMLTDPDEKLCEARCLGFTGNVEELINGPLQELSTRYGRTTPGFVTKVEPTLPPDPFYHPYQHRNYREGLVRQLYLPGGHVPEKKRKRPGKSEDVATAAAAASRAESSAESDVETVE